MDGKSNLLLVNEMRQRGQCCVFHAYITLSSNQLFRDCKYHIIRELLLRLSCIIHILIQLFHFFYWTFYFALNYSVVSSIFHIWSPRNLLFIKQNLGIRFGVRELHGILRLDLFSSSTKSSKSSIIIRRHFVYVGWCEDVRKPKKENVMQHTGHGQWRWR